MLKELLPVLSTLGHIPYGSLSSNDFAAISRFLTKASIEKISILFSGFEIVGVVVLLLTFLKHRGRGCRNDAAADISENISHELLRALAQVIMLSGDRLNDLKVDMLQALLHYSSAHSEPDRRLAAIDGLGNIFVVGLYSAVESVPPASAEANLTLLRSPVAGYDSSPTLDSLHSQAVKSIVDNLKLCCDQISEKKKSKSSLVPSKLNSNRSIRSFERTHYFCCGH